MFPHLYIKLIIIEKSCRSCDYFRNLGFNFFKWWKYFKFIDSKLAKNAEQEIRKPANKLRQRFFFSVGHRLHATYITWKRHKTGRPSKTSRVVTQLQLLLLEHHKNPIAIAIAITMTMTMTMTFHSRPIALFMEDSWPLTRTLIVVIQLFSLAP